MAQNNDNIHMLLKNMYHQFAMLILLACVPFVCAPFVCVSPARANDPMATSKDALESNHKEVSRSDWAKVIVEKKLYGSTKTDRLYAHVYIFNTSDHPIGFDFRQRMHVFYPNQWCESNVPSRQLIDEIRSNQNPPDEKTKQDLLSVMQNSNANHSLVILKPGKFYNYFISLNSGTPKLLEQSKYAYLILVMDGNMALTDGKSIQMLKRDKNDMVKAEVPIKAPIIPSPMRYGANIIE